MQRLREIHSVSIHNMIRVWLIRRLQQTVDVRVARMFYIRLSQLARLWPVLYYTKQPHGARANNVPNRKRPKSKHFNNSLTEPNTFFTVLWMKLGSNDSMNSFSMTWDVNIFMQLKSICWQEKENITSGD